MRPVVRTEIDPLQVNRAELTQQELGDIADVKESLQKCVADGKWRDVLAVLRDSAKVNKLLSAAVLREVEHGSRVNSVAFDAKGTRIATGCDDKKARSFLYTANGDLGIDLSACVTETACGRCFCELISRQR